MRCTRPAEHDSWGPDWKIRPDKRLTMHLLLQKMQQNGHPE